MGSLRTEPCGPRRSPPHPCVQAVGRLPQVLEGALHELERVAVHARAACGGAAQRGGGYRVGAPAPSHRAAPDRPPPPTSHLRGSRARGPLGNKGEAGPPARPRRAGVQGPPGHLLCAGTALPAAGSARAWAPSSATVSSSSSRRDGLGGLRSGGGAIAERREPAALRRAGGSAAPAPPPSRRPPPRPPGPAPFSPRPHRATTHPARVRPPITPPLFPRTPPPPPGPNEARPPPSKPRTAHPAPPAPRPHRRPHHGSGTPRQPRAGDSDRRAASGTDCACAPTCPTPPPRPPCDVVAMETTRPARVEGAWRLEDSARL